LKLTVSRALHLVENWNVISSDIFGVILIVILLLFQHTRKKCIIIHKTVFLLIAEWKGKEKITWRQLRKEKIILELN